MLGIMRPRVRSSLEMISFQDSDFFDALTVALEEINTKDFENPADYTECIEVRALQKIIEDYTNIRAVVVNGDGPAVSTPSINKSHVLRNNDKKRILSELGFDDEKDINKAFRDKKKEKLFGGLLFNENKVTGIYAQMEFEIYYPFKYAKSIWTAQEMAAILLHEVGHIWGFFEMASRTVSTNQVLYDIAASRSDKLQPEIRTDYYVQLKKDLNLTDAEIDQIQKDKPGGAATSTIITGATLRQTESELGVSVYDSTSNEQLADMYSIRCGSKKHLAIALDKFTPIKTGNFFIKSMLFILMLMSTVFYTIFSFGLVPTLLIMYAHQRNSTIEYDNVKTRLLRQKQQLIAELKTSKKPDPGVLEAIDTIDSLMNNHSETIFILDKLALVFNKTYREQINSQKLQQDLEAIGANQLFVQAARLTTGTEGVSCE